MQALSRLNRAAPKWGKKTEDLFVLDFFNLVEDIKASFDPFYKVTCLSRATDINVLHDTETELGPANPNPRGVHGGEQEKAPLDQIIQSFNEYWFQGWGVTTEEKRVKFLSILQCIKEPPDFEPKYQKSQDEDRRALAVEKIFEEVMLIRRRQDLELYRLVAGDATLKSSLQ